MKKRIFSLITILAMLCTIAPMAVVNAATTSKPSVGDGSEDNPYEIGTAEELLWFADRVSDGGRDSICAVLTADITVNPGTFIDGKYTSYAGEGITSWTPIGVSESYPYTGTFDGQNHTISGIYYNDSTGSYIGLFGYIDGATIKNVTLTNSYINAYDSVGGIVGYLYNSGSISNCFNSATVRGYNNVGGIVGNAPYGASIENNGNSGIVSASNEHGGGIVGHGAIITIDNCYNTGTISGNDKVGGIGGYLQADTSSGGDNDVNNCYNIGSVSGSSSVGDIAGYP